MASKFRVRPSEFLGMENKLEAYYLDKAVYHFGTAFDADIEEASKSTGKTPDKPDMTKMKRERRVAKWLDDGTGPTPQQRFRDPAGEI